MITAQQRKARKMNKVELVGRLTKDPEVKLTSNQTQFCNFTVAVDRRFKDSNGQRQADFISCVAWRQTSGNGQGGEQAYHEAPAARPAPAPSFAPPPAGSAASDAPLAPRTPIEPSGDPGFGPGDQVDLPFEI